MPTPQIRSPHHAQAPRRARRRVRPAPVALAVGIATLLPAGPASAAPGSRIADRYIVMYDADVRDPAAATARRAQSQRFSVRRRYGAAVKGFAAVLSEQQVAALRDDPAVAAVVPDRVVRATAQVPLAAGELTPPTGVRRVEAATSSTVGQASTVRVAVIDTGIKLDHPDLNAVSGTNCVGSGSAADDEGHGTHVAGTIGARNQGSGVVGVAPGTTLHAVKVLDARGSGSTSSVVCGIDWVAGTRSDSDPGNDIAVANMSLAGLGSPVTSCAQTRDPMHAAICRATARGVTFTVAAGNDAVAFDTVHEPPGDDPCHSSTSGCPQGVEVPASYPEVLTVTAISDTDGQPGGLLPDRCFGDDVPASFSNFAATSSAAGHTIAAPGACIRSTALNGGTTTMSGTSMAAPHVAGLAALCLGEAGVAGPCASLAPATLIQRLRADAQDRLARSSAYGFTGDPTRPPATGYFGFLGGVAAPLVTTTPDAVPPVPTIETPPDASTTTDATPTFAGTAGVAAGDAAEVTVEVFAGTTTQQARLTLVAPVVGSTWSVAPQTVLDAGTYTARTSQRDAAGNVGLSATSSFAVTGPQPSAEDVATTPAPGDPPALPSPPIAPAQPGGPAGVSPSSPDTRQPAGLAIERARLLGRAPALDVVASLAARATGRLRLTFAARGRTTRFTAPIRDGRVRIRRRLPRAQSSPTGGTLTIAYAGNGDTRAQQVRLHAAPGSPRLRSGRPRISADGRLLARGTVASGVRGAVRVQLEFPVAGQYRSFEAAARIRRGRWELDEPLPATVRSGLPARDAAPQASVSFGGDGPRRVGGQSRSFEVGVDG